MFPHLKPVQRKPGRMGAAAPTGIGQQAYSLGCGSSGSRWSPLGVRPGDGRMEELGKGRQVKISTQGTSRPPPLLPDIPLCPSSDLSTQPFRTETCRPPLGVGSSWKVCATHSIHLISLGPCHCPCFFTNRVLHPLYIVCSSPTFECLER